MSVYDPDNFKGRVALAASYIAQEREGTRSFNTCFEMNDGDAVAVALYRRAKANPEGKLAANIWRYLGRDSVEQTAAEYENVRTQDLQNLAAQMRAKSAAQWERMRAEQEARNAAYRTEFTDAGEQAIIPGCERDDERTGAKQMSLF